MFLIWMALVITTMEEALKEEFPEIETEIPSYVNDLQGGLCIWDKDIARTATWRQCCSWQIRQ